MMSLKQNVDVDDNLVACKKKSIRLRQKHKPLEINKQKCVRYKGADMHGMLTSSRALQRGARRWDPKHPPHPKQWWPQRRRRPRQRLQETPSSAGNTRRAPRRTPWIRGCTDGTVSGSGCHIWRRNCRRHTTRLRADTTARSGDAGPGSNCLQRSPCSAIVRFAAPIYAPVPAASAPPAPRWWFYCCQWRLPSSGGSAPLLPFGKKHIERRWGWQRRRRRWWGGEGQQQKRTACLPACLPAEGLLSAAREGFPDSSPLPATTHTQLDTRTDAAAAVACC